jgi:RNA polymerase sigma-70 factor (ECF subfamily)
MIRNKETVFSDQMLQRLAGPAEDAAARVDRRIEGLRQCMAGLSPTDRQLLDLKYVRQVALADHARAVGLPPGRLQRAISRLRFVLKHCIEKHLTLP